MSCSFSRWCQRFLLRNYKQHWESMAGRGRKGKDQQATDTQELSEGGEGERSFFELFMANQAKRDEEMVERARQEQMAAEARAKRERIEAEERAEERRLRAEIAAEEREEKRREREEERAEARILEKERRKREEAVRLEERNREKEEAAKQAVERAAEMQEEANKKAYEQQRVLMELQADLRKKAAEAHRLENDRSRQRDRVISSLPVYQKEEDVEEFLLATERKLRLGEIPEREWLGLVAAKLNGEVGASWQELCMGGGDYQAVRASLLKGCGYTPRAAGEAYHAFRSEQLRGLAGDQVYRKGAQLLKRMVAPLVMDKEMEFRLVKPWVYSCVGKRARAVLDARVVEDAESLVRGLQDYLASEGDRVSGKTAVFGGEGPSFRKQAYHSEAERERGVAGTAGSNGGSSMKCFRCGKIGHKAADCWQGGAGKQEEATVSKIICFICGVEGHKATTCPGKKEAQKGANVKLIQQVRLGKEYDTVVGGKVNGWGASLVLDSGAHITIVPEDMVAEKWKTGELVELRGYQATTSSRAPTAKVKFCVEGLADWEEIVALAPAEEGRENEIILRLELRTDRGRRLVELARGLYEAKEEAKGKSEKEGDFGKKENLRIGVVTVVKSVEKEVGKAPVKRRVEPVWPSVRQAVAGRGGAKAVVTAKPKVQKAQKKKKLEVKKLEVLSVDKILGTGDGGLTADRPVRNLEPVASDESRKKDEWPDWSGSVESYVGKTVVIERSGSLKPVRALEVVMRASALEQAKFGRVKRWSRWQDRVMNPFQQTSLSSVPAPSAVCGTVEGPEAFTGRKVSGNNELLSTVPSPKKDSRFGDPKRDEGGQLHAGRKRTSSGAEATENDLDEQSEADITGLRAAPSSFVGGDVGSEPPQKEGVATAGVALQRTEQRTL